MATLTWVKDSGVGDFGGYRCQGADYQIERDKNRHYVLFGSVVVTEILKKGSLKACQEYAQKLEDERGTEEAYDKACPCLPEIQTACPEPSLLDEVAELERQEPTPESGYCPGLLGDECCPECDRVDAVGSCGCDCHPPAGPVPVPVSSVERNTEGLKTPDQVRQVLGEIVDRFGADIPPLELPGILVRHGLSTDDVTPGLLRRIARERREKLRQGFREFNELAAKIGSRKRIVVQGDAEFDPEVNPELPGPARDREEIRIRKKEEQRKRLEELRFRKAGEGVDSDGRGDTVPSVDDNSNHSPEEQEEGVMKVNEKAARKLLVAMGYADAADKKKWPNSRIEKEMNDPKSLVEDAKEVAGKDLEILQSICKALEGGGKVKLASVVPATNGKVKAKAGKNGKDREQGKLPPKVVGGSRSERPKIMGKYAAGPFARWLGRKGVAFEEARKILDSEGGSYLSDPSLKWELKEVRDNKPPAKITKEDEKIIKTKYGKVFSGK